MTEKKVVLTYDGLKNMEAELENLKTVRRKDVAEKIKEARGQGDLSENAEYDAAKEEQAEITSDLSTGMMSRSWKKCCAMQRLSMKKRVQRIPSAWVRP